MEEPGGRSRRPSRTTRSRTTWRRRRCVFSGGRERVGVRTTLGMRSARSHGLACALFILASRARAEPPVRLQVVGSGACPSAAGVVGELPRLLPNMALSTARSAASPDDAVIDENPSGFTVTIAGQKRSFEDPLQRCSERVQLAAVFIAIVLDPPRFQDATLEVSPPTTAVRSTTPPARLDLEIGPALQTAPRSGLGSTPTVAGLGLRARWGGAVSLSGGLAGWMPTTLRYPEADARAVWIPLDIGLRFTLSAAQWDAGAELSFVSAPLHVTGQDLSPSESVWRVEMGGRAALLSRFWEAERVGVYLSIYGILFPRPYWSDRQDTDILARRPARRGLEGEVKVLGARARL